GEPAQALLGHAVDAAEVAAVGDADAQVVDHPPQGVDERLSGGCTHAEQDNRRVVTHRCIASAELGPGEVRQLTVDGRTLAVGRSEEGELFAFDNMCAHQGGPLGQGYVDGDTLVCPLHGWSYRLADG